MNRRQQNDVRKACLLLDSLAARIKDHGDTTCKRTLEQQWYRLVKDIAKIVTQGNYKKPL